MSPKVWSTATVTVRTVPPVSRPFVGVIPSTWFESRKIKIIEFELKLTPLLPIVTLTSPLEGIRVIEESLIASNDGITHCKY